MLNIDKFVNVVELLLLAVLTLLQLGRWSQKTEESPADALRIAKEAKLRADEINRMCTECQNHRYPDMDQYYARRREVDLELANIRTRLDQLEREVT